MEAPILVSIHDITRGNVECPTCGGGGWVCENHPDKVWDTSAGGCECGAGDPCSCTRYQIERERRAP